MPACQLHHHGCALAGGPVVGLELPKRVFPCATPADVRSTLPEGKDVLAFQVGCLAGAERARLCNT